MSPSGEGSLEEGLSRELTGLSRKLTASTCKSEKWGNQLTVISWNYKGTADKPVHRGGRRKAKS